MADRPTENARWLRIKALFTAALDQAPDRLAAWLDAHCGGDAELRRELESLIASHRSAAGFMETPAIAEPGAAQAVADRVGPTVPDAMIDRRLGPYRLVAELGRGGMGVVYVAEDARLGREVAVKLLRTDALGSADSLARFEREARLASALQHPNICTIHELGEHEGQPFIAMERLEGMTLRRLLERGAMPAGRVLEFGRQMADALDAAHRHGMIHRDVKPANLFITDGDCLKILDFGVARTTRPVDSSAVTAVTARSSASGRPQDGTDLTGTGITVGTVAYMSPEQALGKPLDARTDLFSVGTVLYEMATGRRAFGGEDVALVITKIINGIVVPARTVNPDIPADLDAIIRKLMAVEPDERYQTAADLLQDINAAIRQPGTLAARHEAAITSRRTARRTVSRRVVGVGVAALLVAIAGLAWVLPRSTPLTARDSLLVIGLDNNTDDRVLGDALATALKAQLGQSPFLDIVADDRLRSTLRFMGRKPEDPLTHDVARDACQRLRVKAMLDGAVAALGSNYVLSLTATDCQTGEVIARDQGEATGKEGLLSEIGRVSKRMRSTLGESLPSVQRFDVPIEEATTPSLAALKAYALGLAERRRGREFESVAFFNEAIDLDHQFASAYAILSTVYGSLGEWQRSDECATLAYQLRNRVSERERLLITYQYHDRVTGNTDLAVKTLELWKADYPRDMRPANALALEYNRAGRYELAEAEAREALRRSPGHPFPLSNLAFAYRSMSRYADARRVAEEAVRLGVETSPTRRLLYQMGVMAHDGSAAVQVAWGKDRPREFDIVSAQAEVAAFEGRLRDASDLYRRAVDIALSRDLRSTATNYIAHLAWMRALYSDPRDVADQVRRVIDSVPSQSEAATSMPRFRASAALALAGYVTEAQTLVKHAVERYPAGTFVQTVLSPTTLAAGALHDGRPDAAIEALQAAAPTEMGTVAGLVPTYLRAEALRQKARFTEAVSEYEKILQHRGVDPFSPVLPMAQLGLARARAGAGDVGGSRRAYEDLFATWRNADAGFAPLIAARAEYRQPNPATRPAVAARER